MIISAKVRFHEESEETNMNTDLQEIHVDETERIEE